MVAEAQVTEVPAPVRPGPAHRPAGRHPAYSPLLIAAVIGLVTALHVAASATASEGFLHVVYVRLYYVPVLYAAWVYGLRGGTTAAVVSAAALGVHAQLQMGGLLARHGDTLVEMAMFLAIGGLFGWLREVDSARERSAREVDERLKEAYQKLEVRAIEMIGVQDYTQSILRSIGSGVITVGPDGSVTTANPAAERMLGIGEAEMVPKPFSALFEDDGDLGRDLLKVLDGRLPRVMREVKLVPKAGSPIQVQASASRMTGAGGRILGAVVSLEDMSEVSALTDQLMRADRLAALGQLTAGVAHEIRNPLGVVRASVQLLEGAQASPERTKEATGVIKEEIDRVDRVIDALLRFGRPPAPAKRTVDLEEVLRDTVLFTRRFADRERVFITEDYVGSLPPVLGDPEQLKQVFVNLVSNAVQAMDELGGTVRVSTDAYGGYVRASVADDGPGIPAEELSRVFDPFFTRRDDGTGLGLTIVHRIVDEHDGHIEVRSTPGEGTVFSVVLPAIEHHEDSGGAG